MPAEPQQAVRETIDGALRVHAGRLARHGLTWKWRVVSGEAVIHFLVDGEIEDVLEFEVSGDLSEIEDYLHEWIPDVIEKSGTPPT
jgi:hypothetical protein